MRNSGLTTDRQTDGQSTSARVELRFAAKNDIIWVYPVDSSFACNSMKILNDNLILITIGKEHHATSYHRSAKV